MFCNKPVLHTWVLKQVYMKSRFGLQLTQRSDKVFSKPLYFFRRNYFIFVLFSFFLQKTSLAQVSFERTGVTAWLLLHFQSNTSSTRTHMKWERCWSRLSDRSSLQGSPPCQGSPLILAMICSCMSLK